jgi:hypothetical protein
MRRLRRPSSPPWRGRKQDMWTQRVLSSRRCGTCAQVRGARHAGARHVWAGGEVLAGGRRRGAVLRRQGDQEPPGVLPPGARGDRHRADAQYALRPRRPPPCGAHAGLLCAPPPPVPGVRAAQHQPVRADPPEPLPRPIHEPTAAVPRAGETHAIPNAPEPNSIQPAHTPGALRTAQ